MLTIKYITSILTFYLRGEISYDKNFVYLKKPNTILALIPLGAKKETIPVSQLSTVETNFKLSLKRLIIGLIITILGISFLSKEPFKSTIITIIGINNIITAFETILTIQTTSGDQKDISILIFEKAKADKVEGEIRKIISDRLDDTNNRAQTDRIVEAINNK